MGGEWALSRGQLSPRELPLSRGREGNAALWLPGLPDRGPPHTGRRIRAAVSPPSPRPPREAAPLGGLCRRAEPHRPPLSDPPLPACLALRSLRPGGLEGHRARSQRPLLCLLLLLGLLL